ncbi:hypothetical protein [Sulfuracidifex tepidarius]|uniref:Uncharacterized protein n=1 Tax=Sulfuracidifex tepidarius TaxID=1294262 RepID=A0A510DY78_9CREN|nr:hypothetical protein [Sulfuracidifex tepidarius]BBG25171.1 hypothetical protein IC006_2506 [Sulfuracidifex tepidarius]BBG27962.1 hypothetical protein IC007_2517 [Sulfuracidifex tepidarius]
MIDCITRDVIRALKFPTDEDKYFQLPTALRIARELKTSFFIVKRSLDDLKRIGFNIYLIPNYNYIGLKKAKVIFRTPHVIMTRMMNDITEAPPSYLDEFTILRKDPLDVNVGSMGIVYRDDGELDNYLKKIKGSYLDVTFMEPMEQFGVEVELQEEDKHVIEALKIPGSVERMLLRELIHDPFVSIKDMSRKVFLKYTSETYRKIRRILDAFTRSKAFLLEPFFQSSNIEGSTLFIVSIDQSKVKGNNRREKIREMKRVLGERYLTYTDYYTNFLSFICYYNNRREFTELKERMIKEGYPDAVYYEDFTPTLLRTMMV